MRSFFDALRGPRNERRDGRATPQDVGRYYDEWTERYLASAGDVIQAYRPAATRDLLDHTIRAAGLAAGMRVLDAGCGVAGPAIHFAREAGVVVDGITASSVQVRKARAAIDAAGLAASVRVVEGDYHDLAQHFPRGAFDAVLFLESLGHSDDVPRAIREAAAALRPGGAVYVKDFYVRETDDPELRRRVAAVVANIDRIYAYNTLDLHETISAIRRADLEIDFVRRPPYVSDISTRVAFEAANGIDIFGGMPPFVAADWLEIRAVRRA